ncbi:unnamed protein product [Penicillium egyptiacum]|uniref:H/ACA ribonucleoprotein complex subunit 2 n=1 Tax=Penicillium egyptiacum TaxID=1303716 RepID=A0A9W4KD78_9EURO|nr:unnamed protein product [Penicillium egyptiacum]
MQSSPQCVAWPNADPALTQELLDLLQQAMHYNQVKKVTKSLTRGKPETVILAADTVPLAILMHLPLVCEDKNVPYVFLPNKHAIGRACGVTRPIIAASVNSNDASDLAPLIERIRDKVDRLAM